MIGLLALSSVASAETQDFQQRAVHYAHDDLEIPKGRRALNRHISAAVEMFCAQLPHLFQRIPMVFVQWLGRCVCRGEGVGANGMVLNR